MKKWKNLAPDGSDKKNYNREIDYAPWLEAILTVGRHYRLNCSVETIRMTAKLEVSEPLEIVVQRMARQAGMILKFTEFNASTLTSWRLPLVVQLHNGQVGVIQSLGSNGDLAITYSGDKGLQSRESVECLEKKVIRALIVRPAKTVSDIRIEDYINHDNESWFKKIVLRDLKPYGHVMVATTVANCLALCGIVFSKQVYDRVIPAESIPTLYVLFSGVIVAVFFDFIMRSLRVRITDLLGKRADIRMSDVVFGHAMRLRNSEKPKSTGTFISQIRELDRIREMITSTTILAVADIPFFFLFVVVMWVVAGPLVYVPLGALILLIVPGLLIQPKMAKLAGESIRESSMRNAMLVETIQGLEDVKALQAEQRFQNQWNHFNCAAAESNLKLRYLVNVLLTWTHNVQSSVFAVVVLFGAPMVMRGDITTGSLVAASILGSRMMTPMARISQVLSRWQQAKHALKGVNSIMELPVDQPQESKLIQMPAIHGNFDIKRAVFQYGKDPAEPALMISELTVRAGEHIAILGKNGSGKSTLLQVLAGLLEAQSGKVNLDGICMQHIDPADLRRDIGLLSQNARLFHGSLRENLTLGAPNASDQEILWALDMSGALDFVQKMPRGLDQMVMEGGYGLSGGQLQSLLISRLLIRQPHILLLDEPTAFLDEATEHKLIQNLSKWSANRSLILATHRASLLKLVDRIIVLDNGRIVVDDTSELALKKLAISPGSYSSESERVS